MGGRRLSSTSQTKFLDIGQHQLQLSSLVDTGSPTNGTTTKQLESDTEGETDGKGEHIYKEWMVFISTNVKLLIQAMCRVLSSIDNALVPAGATSEESGVSKDKDIGLYINFNFIIYSLNS